jgi:hypothetical protein
MLPRMSKAQRNCRLRRLPAYILLGRVAELPEEQIQEAWSRGASRIRHRGGVEDAGEIEPALSCLVCAPQRGGH